MSNRIYKKRAYSVTELMLGWLIVAGCYLDLLRLYVLLAIKTIRGVFVR